MLTVAVIVVLAGWFAVSVVGQVDSRALDWLKARDHFSLIPRWTFFAPKPGTTDYHLVYQSSTDGRALTEWREEQLADTRTVLGAVWNPSKRNKKALCDAVRAMGRMAREVGEENTWQVQYSISYIAVLSYLSGLPHPPSATQIRFMVLESDGFFPEWEPRLLFLSAVHALPDRQPPDDATAAPAPVPAARTRP
ncbi:hypothetical protein SAMN06893096_102512 [Geodermatophilus pulveris]|uniref:Uncharacterized protein n=2 Tax=Geodermatophilus pulveris TaxID=1564159 RepID=A0A239CLY9_9ACTN|nr:hypothetical protein SAMN06893096_102512 [Geodermatophilus pulveris]